MEYLIIPTIAFSVLSFVARTTKFTSLFMNSDDLRVDFICVRLMTENARMAEWSSRMKVDTSEGFQRLLESFPEPGKRHAICNAWTCLQRCSQKVMDKYKKLEKFGVSQSGVGNRRIGSTVGRFMWEASDFEELSGLIEQWATLNDCLDRLTQAPPGYCFTRQVEHPKTSIGRRLPANVPDGPIEGTLERISTEDDDVDYQEASNERVMIKTLYLNCRHALYLLYPRVGSSIHPVFKEVAMRLKLWGSGLFEEGTMQFSSPGLRSDRADSIDLGYMLNPTMSRSVPLRKAILGIFSDIARSIEFMLRIHDNENRLEFSIARVQLLIELGNEEMTVEALEEPDYMGQDLDDVVEVCGKELKASIESLFDLLPAIRRLHHLHLLEREISVKTVTNEQSVNVGIDAEQDQELETDDKSKGQIRKLVEYGLKMAFGIQKSLVEEKEVKINPKLVAEFEYAVKRLSTWHKDVGTKVDQQITEETHEWVRAINGVLCRLAYCFGAMQNANSGRNRLMVEYELEQFVPDRHDYAINCPPREEDVQSVVGGINFCLDQLDRLQSTTARLGQSLSKSDEIWMAQLMIRGRVRENHMSSV